MKKFKIAKIGCFYVSQNSEHFIFSEKKVHFSVIKRPFFPVDSVKSQKIFKRRSNVQSGVKVVLYSVWSRDLWFHFPTCNLGNGAPTSLLHMQRWKWNLEIEYVPMLSDGRIWLLVIGNSFYRQRKKSIDSYWGSYDWLILSFVNQPVSCVIVLSSQSQSCERLNCSIVRREYHMSEIYQSTDFLREV